MGDVIFRNLDFWLGICSSGVMVSGFLHYAYFEKAWYTAEQLSRGPIAKREYHEFWRKNGPRPAHTESFDPTGTGQFTTIHTPATPAKKVPMEELSENVKNGMKEIEHRRKELQYLEKWKSRNSTIGAISGVALIIIVIVRLKSN